MHRDAVIGPEGASVHAELFLQVRLEGKRKRRVDAASERSVQADAPVTDLVAESLHDDGAVVWHRAGCSGLVVEVGEQVLDRQVVEARTLPKPFRRGVRIEGAQLAHHLAERGAELDRTAGRVRLPEGDLPRLAWRRRDEDLRRRDLGDPPRRCPEHKRLADASLVHHLFVELADAPSVLEQVDRIQPAVRDRPGVGDREALRAGAAPDLAGHAIPHDARPKLDELVRRIAAAQHVEHRLKGPRAQVAVRVGAAHHTTEVVDVPLVEGTHRDDLLCEDVKRLARHDGRFDATLEHALHDRGRLEQVAAELRDYNAARGLADGVARTAHALDPGGDAWRGLDLQHEVDRAHVDAELERRSRDEPAQVAGLQLVLDEQTLFARDRPVVGAYQLLLGELVDAGRDSLGEAARIDEHDGRAVLSDQLDESRIDRRPDAVLAFRTVFILSGQPGHVFDRHLDGDLHRLQPPCVHDRDLAVCAAEKTADLLQRALRGREADALRLNLGELAQPLQAQRQVAAALGRRDGMDLVDDQPADRGQDLARGAGQDEEQRLRRGDEDVGRVAFHRPPDFGRCVARPDRNRDVGWLDALRLHLVADADQRRAQVAVDVVRERLQRRHIKDATALSLGGRRL